MSTLLEVKGLKKYFSTPKGMLHAVDDINFTLEQGKTLGIVGESGSGKSTMGRVILHLLSPTDGQIIFDGKDVSKPDRQMLNYDSFVSPISANARKVLCRKASGVFAFRGISPIWAGFG